MLSAVSSVQNPQAAEESAFEHRACCGVTVEFQVNIAVWP